MAKGTLKIKVAGDASNFRRAMDKAEGRLGKFSSKFGRAAKTIGKVGAAGIGAAGAAAVGGAFKVAEFGDEVAKSAGKAGLAVEPFQELRFAFGQGGVEAATMDTALMKFNKRLGESATTGGTADDAFEALGISLHNADGSVRDAGGALDEALPKLAEIESGAERAALAGDLFGQRAGPELAAALEDGIGGIDDARQKAQDLGIVMSGDAAKAAEDFTDSWDDIKQSAGGLLRGGLTPVMEMLSDKVFPWIKTVGIPALKDFGEWLGPKLEEAGRVVTRIFNEQVQPALQAMSDWWDEHGPTIMDWARKIGDFLAANWEPVLAAVAAVIAAALVPAVGALVASLAALFSPVTLIVGGIALLAAGLTYAWKNSETFRTVVTAVWEAVSEVVGKAVDDVSALIEWLTDFGRRIWERWGDDLMDHARTAWEAIQRIIGGVLDVIQGLFDVFMGIFSGDWERAWEGVKQVFGGILDIIAGLWEGILSGIQTGLTIAGDIIRDLWSSLWNWVETKIAEILAAVVANVAGKIAEVTQFFRDLPGTIRGFVSDAGSWLLQAGRNIVQGLIDGMRDMLDNVGDTIGEVAGTVRSYLPFSPAKEGPLSGAGAPDLAGEKIVEMVASGVEAKASMLAQAADRMARAALPDLGAHPVRLPENPATAQARRLARTAPRGDDRRSGDDRSVHLTVHHYGQMDDRKLVNEARKLAREVNYG